MTTTAHAHAQLNRAVVAFLDGRRLRGFIYDFSAVKDFFRLSPEGDPLNQRGTEIKVKELKAIFFVKDFAGNAESTEAESEATSRHGRSMEIVFADGEIIKGNTDAYNPRKLGFFLFPAKGKGNNLRIFVINQNVTKARFL